MNSTTILAGILAGGLYGLIALGLSLVFGVMRLINLAHGQLVIGGAYVAFFVTRQLGLDPLIAMPIAMLVIAAVAYGLQRYLLTDLLRGSETAPLVGTFGLSLLGAALFQAAYGANAQALPASYAVSGFTVLGTQVQTAYLIAFGVALLLTGVTHVVVVRTRAGAAVRAAAAEPAIVELLGIDVKRVYALTFAAAAALAAAGGVMAGVTQSFSPSSGIAYLVVGFTVVALGGVGSVAGTLGGGILLGVLQAIAVQLVGGGYSDVAVYVIFFLALTLCPGGVFSRVRLS